MNKQLLFLSVQFQSVTHKSYTYNNSLNKRDKKKKSSDQLLEKPKPTE